MLVVMYREEVAVRRQDDTTLHIQIEIVSREMEVTGSTTEAVVVNSNPCNPAAV